jgi:hypothetical protein
MNELGPILIDIVDESGVDVTASGHPVLVCHGPGDAHVCPMLEGSPCGLAEDAHGVVFALDLDKEHHRRILEAYKSRLREDVPIAVSIRPDQAAKYPELLTGIRVWTHLPAAGDLDALAAEVEAADR